MTQWHGRNWVKIQTDGNLIYNIQKARMNSWVFKADLKLLKSIFLVTIGRAFHTFDMPQHRSLAPYWLLGMWTCRRLTSRLERRDLDCLYCETSVERYAGAEAANSALWMKQSDLYCTRCLTGSQCRFSRTGVMCSRVFVPVRTRAALFCAICSLEVAFSDKFTRSALLKSNLDVMMAWMSFAHVSTVRLPRIDRTRFKWK